MSNRSPDEQLLVLLNEIRKSPSTEKAEMFCWFLENSSSGENCGYAQKAKKFFYSRHYSEVREIILNMVDLIRQIDQSP